MRHQVLIVAAGALLCARQAADACSCAPPQPRLTPGDGAVGVATDAALFAVATDISAASIELADANTLTPVAVTVEAHTGWVMARPAAPLAGATTYQMTVHYHSAYEADSTTTFTTDATATVGPLSFAGITTFSPQTMTYPVVAADGTRCINSCVRDQAGTVSWTDASSPPIPADAVLATEEIFEQGSPASVTSVVIGERSGSASLGYDDCDVQSPYLRPGATYCARIVVYDRAGRAVGDQAQSCAIAAVCAPQVDTMCAPVATCRAVGSDGSGGSGAATPSSGGCDIGAAGPGSMTGLAFLITRRRRVRVPPP